MHTLSVIHPPAVRYVTVSASFRSCLPNVGGRKCDTCLPGHHSFPYCQTCDCDPLGTEEGICDQVTSQCLCKVSAGWTVHLWPGHLSDQVTPQSPDQVTSQCLCKVSAGWTVRLWPGRPWLLHCLFECNMLPKTGCQLVAKNTDCIFYCSNVCLSVTCWGFCQRNWCWNSSLHLLQLWRVFGCNMLWGLPVWPVHRQLVASVNYSRVVFQSNVQGKQYPM